MAKNQATPVPNPSIFTIIIPFVWVNQKRQVEDALGIDKVETMLGDVGCIFSLIPLKPHGQNRLYA